MTSMNNDSDIPKIPDASVLGSSCVRWCLANWHVCHRIVHGSSKIGQKLGTYRRIMSQREVIRVVHITE